MTTAMAPGAKGADQELAYRGRHILDHHARTARASGERDEAHAMTMSRAVRKGGGAGRSSWRQPRRPPWLAGEWRIERHHLAVLSGAGR